MTAIEWTDETWNPIVGCSVVSPGCTNCYAMRLAGGRLRGHLAYAGLTKPSKSGPVWNGVLHLVDSAVTKPLKWRKPRRIFVNSMGDLFHEAVPDEWIDKVFAVMALCPQHTFQILTKRPERMREYLTRSMLPFQIADTALVVGRNLPDKHPGWARWRWKPSVISGCTRVAEWPLQNVWLGTSVEDAARLPRLDELRATPAATRFVSVEPLLGPLGAVDLTGIDWLICGGESGPGARPMHPDWARSLRDQCQAAGVPFFLKQWGEWGKSVPVGSVPLPVPMDRHGWLGNDGTLLESSEKNYQLMHNDDRADNPRNFSLMLCVGKKTAGRELDGRTWDQMPDVRHQGSEGARHGQSDA